MATFVLGGSPLGLITLKSRPNRDGTSTFNGGESRNIDVNAYNTGSIQETRLRDANGGVINSQVSLFTGGNLPRLWPNIGSYDDYTGLDGNYNGINRDDLHNNEIYDTSILNIIEKLSFSNKASLRPQDFAYLKDLGVYPNNRLVIARRFTGPIKDNIMDRGGEPPKAVMITWKPQDEDFLDFTFSEEWEEAAADFTDIFNSFGEEFRISSLGGAGGAGIGATPHYGFTEQLVRKLYAGLGILEEESSDTPLPSGNPNIIKKAKQRRLVGKGEAGTGLNCDISIKMKVVYEQKFISGIDPTVAWMDILANALSFGTSNSANYGLSATFRNKLDEWTNDPGIFFQDVIDSIKDVITSFLDSIKSAIDSFVNSNNGNEEQGTENEPTTEEEANALTQGLELLNRAIDATKNSLYATMRKYRIPIMGVASALTGAPSTPWHVTIGNPLRPVFCSGDMLTEDVSVKLGPILSFNDLPSNIEVEFTLKNARPLGLQEIMAKFNTGHLRVVNMRRSYVDTVGPSSEPPSYFDDLTATNPTEEPGENNVSSINNAVNNLVTTTKENDTQNTQN